MYMYMYTYTHTVAGILQPCSCSSEDLLSSRVQIRRIQIRRHFFDFLVFNFLQCIAVCCSILQCVANSDTLRLPRHLSVQLPAVCFRVCCSVLQCVAVYCSVVQCVANLDTLLFPRLFGLTSSSVLQCVSVYRSALQCIAVRCSVV